MKTTNLIRTLALGVVLLVGCQKDEDPQPSKQELLTKNATKEWTLTTEREGSKDLFALRKACDRDDILLFKSTGQFELNEGSSKCDAQYPQIIASGAWSFQTNDTELTVGDETYKLVELTAQTLRVSITDTQGTYDATFTAK